MNNPETAQEQLGSELIRKLSQISYDTYNLHFFGIPYIKYCHERFAKILGLVDIDG